MDRQGYLYYRLRCLDGTGVSVRVPAGGVALEGAYLAVGQYRRLAIGEQESWGLWATLGHALGAQVPPSWAVGPIAPTTRAGRPWRAS